jgi:hypothetical protein
MKNITFRFEFNEYLKNEIIYFSKLHKYDDKKLLKENYDKWCNENIEEIINENTRLKTLGYEGDVKNKIFISLKYYFIKKQKKEDILNEIKKNKEITRSKKYITINKDLLKEVDIFIKNQLELRENIKPHIIFLNFCSKEDNIYLLKKIIKEFKNNGLCDAKDIENKIKKIFKNRVFYFTK